MTDLSNFIDGSPLCSTHEHTEFDDYYQSSQPDVLVHLFNNYILHDLFSAGAGAQELSNLLDVSNPDVERRFRAVQGAWQRVEFGGYAEAVKLTAAKLFDIEEIDGRTLNEAAEKSNLKGRSGERLLLLQKFANLDHVQIDIGHRPFPYEMIGQDFFHYDLNLFDLCNGTPDLAQLSAVLGDEVNNAASLQLAMDALFQASATFAIALKSQHAYGRSLRWSERTDREADQAMAAWIRLGIHTSENDRLCLGDWCMSHIARLAAMHDLPFKIHTGYYAENNFMDTAGIAAGHLSGFVRQNPKTRFVMMHNAYPYSGELLAMAKHHSNVAVDMCWAWSINPPAAAEVLRKAIHSLPTNKIFIFGGDANVPAATLGYSLQARRWLKRTLQREIDEGLMSEAAAINLAQYLMMESPRAYFNVAEKGELLRSATREQVAESDSRRAFGEPLKPISKSGRAVLTVA